MCKWTTRIQKGLSVFRRQGPAALLAQIGIFIRDNTRRNWVRLYSAVMRAHHRRRWGDSFAPLEKTIFIDPCSVVHRILPPMDPVGIVDGDWDQPTDTRPPFRLRRVRDLAVFRLLEEHYQQGIPWEQTTLYRTKAANPEANCTNFTDERYDSLEAIRARFEEIDRLYASIRKEGYRQDIPPPGAVTEPISVNIGQSGQFIWNGDGQHRLCLAILMGVPRIPVRVRVRHRTWQEIRQACRQSGHAPAPFANHPDLEEFPAPASPATAPGKDPAAEPA